MESYPDVVVNGQAGVKRIAAAKKLEGLPDHPVNRGALCPRGQAAIQVTYHPDRITQPLKRSGDRGTAQYTAISWDDAIAELVGRLDMLASGGNQRALAILARRASGHRGALMEQFAARFGAPAPLVYELFGDDVLRRANAMSYGRAQLPTFDLANSRYVINFGSDLLGTWNSPVAHSRAYGDMRQGRPGVRGTFVQVESRMSQTGANADEWVPVRPGTEGVLALGIAQVIGGTHPEYTPDAVQKLTGVDARRVERLARAFDATRPAVAIVGGAPLAHTNALFTALAVNALNSLVGSVGQPGGVFFTPQIARSTANAAEGFTLQTVGNAQVVFVDGANPVFTSPAAWKVRESLEKVPYIVSFGSFLDETSALADLILPDHSFLETWSESLPESGSLTAVAGVAPAAMRPLHNTRATGDVLLDVGRRLATPVNLPWQTFDEMLAATFTTLPAATPDADTWTDAQTSGMWTGTLPAGIASGTRPQVAATFVGGPAAFAEPQFDGDAGQYPFHFLPYPSSTFLDGSLAHLPWLQEMPDPMTSGMWSSWVEINPATAQKLGIAERDVVEIASAHGTLQTAAVINPGLAPDMLAMPVGQGHTTFTRFASGRGQNPVALLAPVTEPATGALAWAATRVRIARVGPADGRLVMFAGGIREHVEHAR
jgi:anaerobic selenocysteine-containing dehydrogenase